MEEAPDTHVSVAAKSRRRFGFETVASVSAIVVAVASLFVAWDEAGSVRRQQAASVLPIVKIDTRYLNSDTERSYEIRISNVGVGPAFIDRGVITWDGMPVQTVEDLEYNVVDLAGDADFWTSELQGQIVGGGESFLLYRAVWDPDVAGSEAATRKTVAKLWESMDMNICFCSVYDSCWTTRVNHLGRPSEVRTCSPS